MSRKVAVFGSAHVKAGQPEYEASVTVGRALAQAGFSVMTGGYDGVMEAASKGAAEAGGHVIGVTVRELDLTGERTPNRWLHDQIRHDTMRQRLHYLVDEADAYIAMPGGVGTLQEIAEAWQMQRLNANSPKPLVAMGDFWRGVLGSFQASPYVPPEHQILLAFASTPDEVIEQLMAHFSRLDGQYPHSPHNSR